MADPFETTATSARRTSSGTKFSLSRDPFEQREVRYESPASGIEVKFQIRWMYEPRPVPRGGRIIEVCLGAILIGGELRAAMAKAAGAGAGATGDAAAIDDLVRDCHELIAAHIRARTLRDHAVEVKPRLYEAAEFGPFFSSLNVRPDAVSRLHAVQVL